MAINPFDPRASSPDQIAKQFGDMIKKELYEIGYSYVGMRRLNCSEDRIANKKRARVVDEKSSYVLNLWYGTSKWVDCFETADTDPEENPTPEIFVKGIYLSIFIAQLQDQLDIVFQVNDHLDILNLKDGFTHQELDSMNTLLSELRKIKMSISQNK